MERVTGFILARPWGVIASVLLATALLGFQLRTLRPEVSIRDLVPRDHPFTHIDERLRADFGAGQTNLVALRVASGDVFDVPTLRKVQRLTDAITRLPGVEPGSVYSLTSPNVQAMRAGADGVEVGPLLAQVPEDAAGLDALRRTVAAHPMFVGNLVTADGRGTLISADFAEPVAVEEVTHALEALAAGERDARTRIDVGGQSAALAALQAATRGIAWPLLLALVVVGVVHYEAFRTPQAVVLPLATACLSVVWSLGLTSLFGVHVTPWTAITTILVLSVAAGHAVQILARYYECYAELGDTRAAVRASLERVGPVMLTAGTVAAAGFASLATFGVPAVREFGLVAACGILSALLIELTFIPAVRSVLPPPQRREAGRAAEHRLLGRAIEALGDGVVARPRGVLAAVGTAVALAGTGVAFLHVNTAFRAWFSPDAPVIVADRAIRDHVTGTSTLRLRFAAEDDASLLDPAALRGVAALESTLRADPAVTATLSIADPIRQMNRAMHGDDADAYAVPDDAALVEQYMLLIDPARVARLITPDHRAAALYALSRSDDVAWVESMLARLQRVAARELPPSVRVEIAGGELAQAAANNRTVVHDKIENMLQVGLVIFALSAAVFRSLVAGLLVLAPLACAVAVNLGVMGWVGTDLSFATATYTSMGVSLGADFAIYLLFRLREELRERTLEQAMRETLRTSGRAIFFVASAIAAGYATVLVSDFLLWRQLGGYVALIMVTSSLATLSVVPPLVLLIQPRFLRAGKERAPAVLQQPS